MALASRAWHWHNHYEAIHHDRHHDHHHDRHHDHHHDHHQPHGHASLVDHMLLHLSNPFLPPRGFFQGELIF